MHLVPVDISDSIGVADKKPQSWNTSRSQVLPNHSWKVKLLWSTGLWPSWPMVMESIFALCDDNALVILGLVFLFPLVANWKNWFHGSSFQQEYWLPPCPSPQEPSWTSGASSTCHPWAPSLMALKVGIPLSTIPKKNCPCSPWPFLSK